MNILIKLMSIVSLVIAPTLATMNWATAAENNKQQLTSEVSIIKTDSTDDVSLTVTADANSLKLPTEALIDALVADKLIEKNNFTLSLSKGTLSLNDKEVTADVAAKYQSLLDALGDADLRINNTQQ